VAKKIVFADTEEQ